MYGSKVDGSGKEIQGDSTYLSPVAGERVEGNTLVSIGLAEDKDGNIVDTRANIIFQQDNGAQVRITLFEAVEQWQFDSLNKQVKHVATKLMTEEQYYTGINAGGAPTGFQDFIAKVSGLLTPLAAGKLFTMKFVYKNGYVGVPSFPNWIALPENADTLTTNPKYDKYIKEEPTDVAEGPVAGVPTSSDVF
tara:strand:+ start:4599 stop:5171 length:573 start_codon:yes stop_codon:yes gene_type:complete